MESAIFVLFGFFTVVDVSDLELIEALVSVAKYRWQHERRGGCGVPTCRVEFKVDDAETGAV